MEIRNVDIIERRSAEDIIAKYLENDLHVKCIEWANAKVVSYSEDDGIQVRSYRYPELIHYTYCGDTHRSKIEDTVESKVFAELVKIDQDIYDSMRGEYYLDRELGKHLDHVECDYTIGSILIYLKDGMIIEI
ncbi:MAG: hypothetical protein ACRCX2_15695 [Paraclostridium sp.]